MEENAVMVFVGVYDSKAEAEAITTTSCSITLAPLESLMQL
ncbi:MAG: hypothetical protein JWL57_1320 [Actinobacteria bacterium]|jgi:hypothetical protein|nr:hypothetical protein [Actinomycetota bacterium]